MITCLFTSHRLPSTSAHRSQQAASANSAELGCGHKNGVMMMVIHTNERRDPLQRVRDESVPIGGLWGGNEACSRRPPDPPSPHPVCMLASLPPVECGFIQHVPHRQVTVALWRGVHGESEQDVPHYPTPNSPSARLPRGRAEAGPYARSPLPCQQVFHDSAGKFQINACFERECHSHLSLGNQFPSRVFHTPIYNCLWSFDVAIAVNYNNQRYRSCARYRNRDQCVNVH